MNAIKNYLDNMFRNLPNTEEVRKAKSELLQMMEDKYEELIADGKSENEAVGIVISEFGNLEEVAESIGLSLEIKQAAPEKPMLSMERVKEYIAAVSGRSLMIPLAVALCIMSVTGGIAADIVGGGDFAEALLGGGGFFLMIAAAVVLFITSRSKNKAYEDINKNAVSMGIETTEYVVNEKKRYRPTYSMTVGIGIALCICCVAFPIIISAIPFVNDDFGALTFFLAIATGVFLIVHSNVRMNGYDRLLKLNGEGSMSEEFIPSEERKISKWPIVLGIITVVVVIGLAMVFGAVRVFSGLFFGNTEAIEHNYELGISDDDAVDKISIEARACSVIISRDSSVDGVEVEYEGTERLMPEITYRNGEISVLQDVSGEASVNYGHHGPEVTIRIGDGIDIGDIDFSMDAGNLEFTGITADDVTGGVDAGNIEINGCEISSFVLTCDAGNIEIDNTGFELIDIDTDFGNINIDGIDDVGYYACNIECEAGVIEIDGHDEGRSYSSNGTGTGEIRILLDAGNIEIN